MSWAGADDTWSESDVTFATWLAAMSTFRHTQVLAEALAPAKTVAPEPRKTTERPFPKKPPKTPRPQHVAEHLPTATETFTAQQIQTAERLLGITTTKENS